MHSADDPGPRADAVHVEIPNRHAADDPVAVATGATTTWEPRMDDVMGILGEDALDGGGAAYGATSGQRSACGGGAVPAPGTPPAAIPPGAGRTGNRQYPVLSDFDKSVRHLYSRLVALSTSTPHGMTETSVTVHLSGTVMLLKLLGSFATPVLQNPGVANLFDEPELRADDMQACCGATHWREVQRPLQYGDCLSLRRSEVGGLQYIHHASTAKVSEARAALAQRRGVLFVGGGVSFFVAEVYVLVVSRDHTGSVTTTSGNQVSTQLAVCPLSIFSNMSH